MAPPTTGSTPSRRSAPLDLTGYTLTDDPAPAPPLRDPVRLHGEPGRISPSGSTANPTRPDPDVPARQLPPRSRRLRSPRARPDWTPRRRRPLRSPGLRRLRRPLGRRRARSRVRPLATHARCSRSAAGTALDVAYSPPSPPSPRRWSSSGRPPNTAATPSMPGRIWTPPHPGGPFSSGLPDPPACEFFPRPAPPWNPRRYYRIRLLP